MTGTAQPFDRFGAGAADPFDRRLVAGATGLLGLFNQADVLDAADVHAALRLCALGGEHDETVALAVALAVRALRGGSVCVDLAAVAEQSARPALPWPEPAAWVSAVEASPLTAGPSALRLHGGTLLYLDRYWREETQVCADLLTLVGRRSVAAAPVSESLFPAGYAEQRAAAEIALSQALTVLTGGPGTGKTTTVARLLALFAEQAELSGRPQLRIALAAPTGKAAARLAEAVRTELVELDPRDRARLPELHATTLHRLLGAQPDNRTRFRHDRSNRLPHEVIVVDETSMVSLTLMARLLEAVRPDARLVLVGDPDQLASVEAGAVLADLVAGLDARSDTKIAALVTSHRFGGAIGDLAAAIRDGAADRVVELLEAGAGGIEWITDADPADRLRTPLLTHALRLRAAALDGDDAVAVATLNEQRLLCAHRRGPFGVAQWNAQLQRWLSEETGEAHWSPWYAGRPLLVTANNPDLGVYNGETGLVMRRDTGLRAVIDGAERRLDFATSRLAEVETMHAMTIHKSQGSQADEVIVLLPTAESRLLTRELFYTAVTRAKTKVWVAGSEAAVRAALARRAARASGLAQRLAHR